MKKRFFFWGLIFFLGCFLFGQWAKVAHALTTEEERKMGQRILLEMERKVDFVRDLLLQDFVDRVGRSLVAQLPSTPFGYRFFIIQSTDANAYAIPGGYVFVTTGLLVLADNEQEVAGVLSHEIAHVQRRHVAQMIERSKTINLASLAAMLAGLFAGGGRGGEAIAMTSMAAAESLMLKYTREMETEADQVSLPYLIKAGYDPKGLIVFLTKMNRMSLTSASKVPQYLLTHPITENRIALLENLLLAGYPTSGPYRDSSDYRKIQAKAFVAEREPQVAVSHFESLVATQPEALEAYYGLGLAYGKMGRWDKSLEAFQKGCDLSPRDPDLLTALGQTYILLGKLDQAVDQIERARSLELETGRDDDLATLYLLGRAYQEKGDTTKALPLLLKVQQRVPDFIEVNHNLGSLCGRRGEIGLSHFYFARYFRLKGEYNNALLHFKKALEGLRTGSPEREEAEREIKRLTPGAKRG